MKRALLGIAAALMLTSGASGYYHFVHFLSSAAPFTPVPEKYDLTALRNKTLPYFIADDGPDVYAPGDSFTALLSQIRMAAKTWNEVGTSELRIGFGGLVPAGNVTAGAAIDVSFDDDIPPGLIAYGGPTSLASNFVTNGSDTFAPITHSVVRIRRDLTSYPSFGEDLFVSMVHEFGHALGLQHTLTGAVMCTSITRGTTKAHPLGADDVAGISILYPSQGFLQTTATISGVVNLGGSGVNLASVVAISGDGPAVSSLTNPDGTYTIQGIPAGRSYYIYAHPLPPPLAVEVTPANVVPPKDASGQPIPATGYFDTQFFPGTRDPNQATSLFLSAGDVRDQINFNVAQRSAPAISSVTTYGYYGESAVHPAPLLVSSAGATMVATGTGLLSGTDLTPGLTISTLGGASVIAGTTAYYTGSYLMFGLAPTFGDAIGSRHLLFSTPSDMYVLPSGFLLVHTTPPTVDSVTAAVDDQGNRAALITGSNLTDSTGIRFDGVPAPVIRRNGDGSMLVSLPSAPGGFRSNVTAYNADGQSSLFVQNPPTAFTYDAADSPSFSVNPSTLPAGSEAMVEITAANVSFTSGQVSLGFGSPDVVVRRTWVTGPNRLIANVAVGANSGATVPVTVAAGLQNLYSAAGLQVVQSDPKQPVLSASVVNAATGGASISAGSTAILTVANLSAAASALTLQIGDDQVPVISATNGQVTFQIPATATVGPAVLKLQVPGTAEIPPVVIQIDPPPPAIQSAYSAPGVFADNAHPARPGTLVTFAVSNLPVVSAIGDASALHFNIGGVDHTAVLVTGGQPGMVNVQVMLAAGVPVGGQVPVTLTYNGTVSGVFSLVVSQ